MRLPRLLAVADPGPGASAGPDWKRWCEALARAGVDGLQLRDRGLGDRLRFERAIVARASLPAPSLLFVNSRADLALAAAADGVQLPASGLPLQPLRAAFGDRLGFGRSTHRIDEIRAAGDEGIDFVLFGPIFATPSKVGRIEPRGISSLAEAVRVGPPVIAIGGIDFTNAAAVAATGVAGIAAIRLFAEPTRDESGLRELAALFSGTELG